MKQSAESINSLNSDRVGKTSLRRGGIRDLEIDAAMGPGGVVVIDELDEDALEVAFVPDEEPVQTLGPHSANESFGERVRQSRQLHLMETVRPEPVGARNPSG